MATLSLLGYGANEAERVTCALHELRGTLQAPDGAAGFGVAHFMDDRLLLNLRPSAVPATTSVADLVGSTRTRHLIASMHVDGDLGPFKFRSWAFAMRGTAGRGSALPAMTAQMPDFLKRNITSDALGEAAFHRFLATLHEANQVDDPDVEPVHVAEALRSTLDLLVFHSMGAARPSMVVSNGRILAAAHVGGGLAYTLREGIVACQHCKLDQHALDTFALRESHRRFRGVMIAGGLNPVPPGFMEVPTGKAVVVSRKLEVQLI